MDVKSEEKLPAVFEALRIFLLPCPHLETFALRLLHVDSETPFRMFPIHDAPPEYPSGAPNAISLFMLLIPLLVALGARPTYGLPVGRLLHPLVRRCSLPVA